MSSSRIVRRKVRKKKKKSKVLFFFLLLFAVVLGYGVYEFQAGQNLAAENGSLLPGGTDKEDLEEFNGAVNNMGKVNILLLGADGKGDAKGRTDTIMIAQYDPKTNKAKIASIMRDSYVSIPGHGQNKINAALPMGGPELVRQTIKENFGIDTEYYAMVNFDGFTEIVDEVAPKGVKIDVEKDMQYTDRAGGLFIDLKEGEQKLDGEQLLHYARFRHDAESDFGRVRRQQQVIQAVKDEIVSVKGALKLPRMLGMIDPYIETNISKTAMLGLGKDFFLNTPENIDTMRVPVDGSFGDSYVGHAGSVLTLDKEQNAEALQEFFNDDKTDEKTAAKKDDEDSESNS
ncbi:LCP family protein [Bacillus tianshenii]|nr:LCP family protein [Bacillus tianshenii]